MTFEHETEEQMEHVEVMPESSTTNGFHLSAAEDVDYDAADDDSDAPIELADGPATDAAVDRAGDDIRADHVTISQGAVGVARVDSLTVEDGGSAFAVMADSASVEQGASVFMLLARSTSGDVRPVLDWRAALSLGAGVGLVLALLRRLR